MPITKKIPAPQFAKEYYGQDDTGKPLISPVTIKNHIERGILSGEKLGGRWYVFCHDWGDPIYYHTGTPSANAPVYDNPLPATGNELADKILASLM